MFVCLYYIFSKCSLEKCATVYWRDCVFLCHQWCIIQLVSLCWHRAFCWKLWVTIGGLDAAVNYLWTKSLLVPVFRIPDTINNVLSTLSGKKFLRWLVQKGATITFSHCDIVLDLLFTVFFFCYNTATVVPRRENINVTNVSQLEKDAILVCYDSKFKNV